MSAHEPSLAVACILILIFSDPLSMSSSLISSRPVEGKKHGNLNVSLLRGPPMGRHSSVVSLTTKSVSGPYLRKKNYGSDGTVVFSSTMHNPKRLAFNSLRMITFCYSK